MKKIVKIFLIILTPILFLMSIVACEIIELNLNYVSDEELLFNSVKEETKIDFSACKIINAKDTHGGILGDGELFEKYNCKNLNVSSNQLEKLNRLPLSKNLNIMIYGDEELQHSGVADDIIPKIENGYYYFIDNYSRRYEDLDDIHSDENLLDRYSSNFSLLIYDVDEKYLYYYELDT